MADKLYLCAETLIEKFNNDFSSLTKGENPINLPYLDTYLICMMLFAFAVENQLKSLILKNGNNLYNKNTLENKYKTHDLNRLFDFTGLQKTIDEKQRLSTLTEFCIWAGKYPLPLDIKGLSNLLSPGKCLSPPENLYRRLRSEINK